MTKKQLGLYEIFAIGVGGMIGGGLFSIMGLVISICGNGAPFAYLIGAFIALFTGYSYSKLAICYSSDGASFTYLEKAFPSKPYIAAFVGWTVVTGYIGTLSLYAYTFGVYTSHLFTIEDSAWSRHILGVLVLCIFLFINLKEAKEVGIFEDVLVYLKIFLLAIFGIIGFFTLKPSHFTPIFDEGIPSIFLGAAVIFVAYEGFQLITNAVCETKNPSKLIPRGIFGSILTVAVIYISFAIITVGNLSLTEIIESKEYAIALVAKSTLGPLGVIMVDIMAIFASTSAINATLFGASRMAREIAKEGLAPQAFSFRNREGSPYFSLIVITLCSSLMTLLGTLTNIATFSSFTFLVVSFGVLLANYVKRKETKSSAIVIVAGMALISTTSALLITYLIRHSWQSFFWIFIAYGCICAGLFAYCKLKRIKIIRLKE